MFNHLFVFLTKVAGGQTKTRDPQDDDGREGDEIGPLSWAEQNSVIPQGATTKCN